MKLVIVDSISCNLGNVADDNTTFGIIFSRHIVLIHANLLNSHFLGDIIHMYRSHGYKFITLEEALKQPANAIPLAKASKDALPNAKD